MRGGGGGGVGGAPPGLYDSDSEEEFDMFCDALPERPRRYYNAINDFQGSEQKIERDLQEAINAGDIDSVKDVIQKHLKNNANTKLHSGWTPLMHACLNAQDQVVAYLLEAGADVNLHCDSITPLHAACTNETADSEAVLSIINALTSRDALMNVGDKYGQTPLMKAINNGRVAIVQELLKRQVNIEMRDQQGWTAVFWAVQSNQPDILEILICHSARLQELDKHERTPLEIAEIHGFNNIIEILRSHLNDEDEELITTNMLNNNLQTWHDYYPGVKSDDKPRYSAEIRSLLYGMSCERLTATFEEAGVDLHTFLLMDDEAMRSLGVDLPFERKRLKLGLRRFHTRGWKIDAAAGLYAQSHKNYNVLDCLTALGAHLHQLCILDASIRYCLRDLRQASDKLKFEPQHSPVRNVLETEADKLRRYIANVRREIGVMEDVLKKIGRSNPPPADLIYRAPQKSPISNYIKVAAICSVTVLFVHQARNYFSR